MGMITAISVGDYPRIGDSNEQQVLRRALHRYDREFECDPDGSAKRPKLEQVAQEAEEARQQVVQQVVEEQQRYLDVITDGQVYWEDPISHPFQHFSNVEMGPLEIFFKTNRLYRRPKILGPLALEKNFLCEEYQTALRFAQKPIRVVITGPYTLARHAETASFERMQEEIAQALNQELRSLNGCILDEIQVDEPSFSDEKPAWDAYTETFGTLTEGVAHPFALNPYWAHIADDIGALAELPIATLHIDLANFHLDERLLSWPRQAVLGVFNAEKRKPEDLPAIKEIVRRFAEKYAAVRIACNTGLRYLARNKAQEKLQVLQRLKEELNTGSS